MRKERRNGVLIESGVLRKRSLSDSVREEWMWELFKPIADSVVCIRQDVLYERGAQFMLPYEDAHSLDDARKIQTPFIKTRLDRDASFGTGIVIGEEKTKHGTEFYILTNNHVANSSPMIRHPAQTPGGGLVFVESKLYDMKHRIVKTSMDNDEANWTRLELIATAVDKDAAIMRTVGAKKRFTVYPYDFGLPKPDVTPGDIIITTGFPGGSKKITATGHITTLDNIDFELTPVPHRHYLVDFGIDPGQSGSPVVMPMFTEVRGGVLANFFLIGLCYGGANDDTTRMITPWESYARMVEERKSMPSMRPSLLEPVTKRKLQDILRDGEGLKNTYEISNRRFFLERTDRGALIKEYSLFGSYLDKRQHAEWHLEIADDVRVTGFEFVKNGERTPTDLTDGIGSTANTLARGLLNNFRSIIKATEVSMMENMTEEISGQHKYHTDVANEQSNTLIFDLHAFYSELYKREVVNARFL